jgi:hypothetical protein
LLLLLGVSAFFGEGNLQSHQFFLRVWHPFLQHNSYGLIPSLFLTDR